MSMRTLTADDSRADAEAVLEILRCLDPQGEHKSAATIRDARRLAADAEVLDAAFLNVEMPDGDGMNFARELEKKHPLVNIIFIADQRNEDNNQYAMEAFRIYASAYLLKPVSEEIISDAIAHLRYRNFSPDFSDRPIQVRCFGVFEATCQGKPVEFRRSKTEELFAYLIDRQGAMCTADMIIGNLWPEEPVSASKQNLIRIMISDLKTTLRKYNAENIVLRGKGTVGLNINWIDCDYFRYLWGDPIALHQFRGEYMSQYAFAADTLNGLMRRYFE